MKPIVRPFARFLPPTYIVTRLRGLWFGEAWNRRSPEHFFEFRKMI